MQEQKNSEQTLAEIEKLAFISRLINESDSLAEIVETVVGFIRDEFDIDGVILMLVDEERRELYVEQTSVPVSAPSSVPEFARALRIPLESDSALARVHARGRSLYAPRVLRGISAPDIDRNIITKLQLSGYYAVPLVVQSRSTGLLLLTTYAQRMQLTPAMRARIDRYSQQIAGAVRMASLLRKASMARQLAQEEARHARAAGDESRKMAEFTRRINETTDIGLVLDEVFEHLRRAYGAESIVVQTVDSERQELHTLRAYTEGRHADADMNFAQNLHVPLGPEGGTIYRTFRKQKPFYLPPQPDNPWYLSIRPDSSSVLSPLDQKIAHTLRLESLAQFPLIVQKETIGILWCSFGNQRRDSREIESIFRFCGQIAGAIYTSHLVQQVQTERDLAEAARNESERLLIETRRAREEADNARSETQALADFSRRINELAEGDLEQIVQSIFEYLQNHFGIEGGVLSLVEIKSNTLNSRYNWSASQQFTARQREYCENLIVPLSPEGGALARTVKRQRPLYFPKIEKRPGLEIGTRPIDREIIETLELTNFLHIPLLVQGRTIGVIWCTNRFTDLNLDRGQIQRIQSFADQIAVAVHHAQILKQNNRARAEAEQAQDEAEILSELARRANESNDLDHILHAVTEIIKDRFQADAFSFILTDVARKNLVFRSGFVHNRWVGVDEVAERIRLFPIAQNSGMIYRTLQKKKVIYVDRISSKWLEKYPIDAEYIQATDAVWFVHVPLLLGDEAVGILIFSGSRPSDRLSQKALQFCERIGAQISGAVRMVELLQQTDLAKQRSDQLLRSILPDSIANELKLNGRVEPLLYNAVTVLFTDFVGFTQASQKMRPDELVRELDGCFSQFDEVAGRNSLEKLKTIGDAYMCAGGLPTANRTHAIDVCMAALEFRTFILQMAEIKAALGHEFWRIRIGIHTGPVTAGVIGANKFSYDIWGDTVNTASRMESAGVPDRINVSRSTYDHARDFFLFEARGQIEVKGKGALEMFFLNCIRPELSADEDGLVPNDKFRQKLLQLTDRN
ncbi:MAG: GAF domain-containing protein [Leptospiraceae bacterium]|nr:GAF domain-containing protein [Leptospiraceae bacterium]